MFDYTIYLHHLILTPTSYSFKGSLWNFWSNTYLALFFGVKFVWMLLTWLEKAKYQTANFIWYLTLPLKNSSPIYAYKGVLFFASLCEIFVLPDLSPLMSPCALSFGGKVWRLAARWAGIYVLGLELLCDWLELFTWGQTQDTRDGWDSEISSTDYHYFILSPCDSWWNPRRK